jgi:hypothetical protein
MTIDEKCRYFENLKEFAIPVLFILGLILFIWGIRSKEKYSLIIRWLGILIFIGLFSYLFFFMSPIKDGQITGRWISKTFLREIQNSLEAYAIDHNGLYPEDISLLIPQYLKTMPENVYTAEPMKDIEFGSEGFEGDFSYEPVYTGQEITDYLLFLYGLRYSSRMDMESEGVKHHVILVLSSDGDDQSFWDEWLESKGISAEEYYENFQ